MYGLNPLTNSWDQTGAPLRNDSCQGSFGNWVSLADKGLMITCGGRQFENVWHGKGFADTTYYYEKEEVKGDYTLHQVLNFHSGV